MLFFYNFVYTIYFFFFVPLIKFMFVCCFFVFSLINLHAYSHRPYKIIIIIIVVMLPKIVFLVKIIKFPINADLPKKHYPRETLNIFERHYRCSQNERQSGYLFVLRYVFRNIFISQCNLSHKSKQQNSNKNRQLFFNSNSLLVRTLLAHACNQMSYDCLILSDQRVFKSTTNLYFKLG